MNGTKYLTGGKMIKIAAREKEVKKDVKKKKVVVEKDNPGYGLDLGIKEAKK